MADQIKLRKRLEALLKLPENQICADCSRRGPRWASANLGIFICIECSGIHRNLGVHISFVRSVNLDSWTTKQVEYMELWGNAKANEYFEANIPRDYTHPNENDTVKVVERFIRDKYEHKKFVGKKSPPKDDKLNQQSENNDDEATTPNRTKTTSKSKTTVKTSVAPTAPVAAPAKPVPVQEVNLLDLSEPTPPPLPPAQPVHNNNAHPSGFDFGQTAFPPTIAQQTNGFDQFQQSNGFGQTSVAFPGSNSGFPGQSTNFPSQQQNGFSGGHGDPFFTQGAAPQNSAHAQFQQFPPQQPQQQQFPPQQQQQFPPQQQQQFPPQQQQQFPQQQQQQQFPPQQQQPQAPPKASADAILSLYNTPPVPAMGGYGHMGPGMMMGGAGVHPQMLAGMHGMYPHQQPGPAGYGFQQMQAAQAQYGVPGYGMQQVPTTMTMGLGIQQQQYPGQPQPGPVLSQQGMSQGFGGQMSNGVGGMGQSSFPSTGAGGPFAGMAPQGYPGQTQMPGAFSGFGNR